MVSEGPYKATRKTENYTVILEKEFENRQLLGQILQLCQNSHRTSITVARANVILILLWRRAIVILILHYRMLV